MFRAMDQGNRWIREKAAASLNPPQVETTLVQLSEKWPTNRELAKKYAISPRSVTNWDSDNGRRYSASWQRTKDHAKKACAVAEHGGMNFNENVVHLPVSTWFGGTSANRALPIPADSGPLTREIRMGRLIHPPDLSFQSVEVYANGQKNSGLAGG